MLVEEVQARIETSKCAQTVWIHRVLFTFPLFSSDLELLGATAVEDTLQDHVKDTLESLRYAGITVWVLTGDKIETAFNIGKACGHIPEDAKIYFITECKEDFQVHQHLQLLEGEMKVISALFISVLCLQ